MSEFYAVVPARYASTRLPGKPLLDIAGRPMVVWVAERARASGAKEVWVATDHDEVAHVVKQHGFEVCMTSIDCASGTDRLAEVAAQLKWPDEAVVVNVQGDEPLIEPELIRATAETLARHPDAAIATVCHPLHDIEEVMSPNVVKVVQDKAGYALYFSRAPIPYARDAWAQARTLPAGLPVMRHVGLYAYRVGFLHAYPRLERPAVEAFESLEQLRAMWHGYKIAVLTTDQPSPPGVDTADDLEKVRRIMAGQG